MANQEGFAATRNNKNSNLQFITETVFLTQLSRRKTPKLEDLSMGELESPDA